MPSVEGGGYTSFTSPPTCSRLNNHSNIMNSKDASDNGSNSNAIFSSHSLGHRSIELTGVGETTVLRNHGTTIPTNSTSTHGGNVHHESILVCTNGMSTNNLHPSGSNVRDGGSGTKSSTSAPTAFSSTATPTVSSTTGSSSGIGAGVSPFCFIPCDDSSSSPYSFPTSEANALLIFGLPWYAREKEINAYLCHVYPVTPPLTTRLYTFPHNGVSRGICYVEYPVEVEVRKRGAPSFSLATVTEDHLPYGRRRQQMGTAVSSLQRFPGHSTVSTSSSSSSSSFTTAVEVVRVDWGDIQHRIMAHPWDNTIALMARCYYLPMNASSANHWDRAGNLPPLPIDPPPTKALVGYGEEGRSVRCGVSLELPNTCTSAEAYNRVEMCRKRLRRVFSANTKARAVPAFFIAE